MNVEKIDNIRILAPELRNVTTGYQNVLLISHRYACHTEQGDEQSSENLDHSVRSSGVKVILNER